MQGVEGNPERRRPIEGGFLRGAQRARIAGRAGGVVPVVDAADDDIGLRVHEIEPEFDAAGRGGVEPAPPDPVFVRAQVLVSYLFESDGHGHAHAGLMLHRGDDCHVTETAHHPGEGPDAF